MFHIDANRDSRGQWQPFLGQKGDSDLLRDLPGALRSLKTRDFTLPFAVLMAGLGLFATFTPKNFQNYAGRGDLYPRWYGARAAFQGRDPYSPEVTAEIQKGYYGHALATNEPTDQQRFAYPAYVVFLMWPLTRLPFPAVRVLVSVALLGALVCSVLLWIRILGCNLTWKGNLTAVLLAAGTAATIQGIRLQQLGILVFLLFSAGIYFLCRDRLTAAGVAFALATIKPQMMLLPLLWIFIWTWGDWRKRRAVAVSFALSLGALSLLAELLVRGWIPKFLHGLIAYTGYRPTRSLLTTLIGTPGTVLSAGIIILFLVVAFRHRVHRARASSFHTVTALALCVAQTCVPGLVAPFNQILLLPAVLILIPISSVRVKSLILVSVFLPTMASVAIKLAPNPDSSYVLLLMQMAVVTMFALSLCVLALMMSRMQWRSPRPS
jgi:hypothetical protein